MSSRAVAAQVVGIDCARVPKKIGLARGRIEQGARVLIDAHKCRTLDEIRDTIVGWINSHEPTLLALDAPLGWPAPLGAGLARHTAGEQLPGKAHDLFRRETDRFIRDLLGKQPLDVGADRIARTAHAALVLLEEIRRASGLALPLAWTPGLLASSAAIEVYPAATLIALGHSAARYKGKQHREGRETLVGELGAEVAISEDLAERLSTDVDLLDAAVCVVAGFDFLDGRAVCPPDLALARKEGWIWTRPPAR